MGGARRRSDDRSAEATRRAAEQRIQTALADGNASGAATALLEAYGREIYGFIATRIRDEDGAAEAFSMFTENLWKGLPRFEGRSSARVWAYTIARHAAVRFASAPHRRRERNVPLSEAEHLSPLAQKIRTETQRYLKTEAKTQVDRLRERLDPEDRMLLVLRVNRQLEWDEVARVFSETAPGPSDEDVRREAARLRKRFQLVKQQIRRMADEEGPDED